MKNCSKVYEFFEWITKVSVLEGRNNLQMALGDYLLVHVKKFLVI